MNLDTYPRGVIRTLLDTDLVTPPTREALRARLEPVPTAMRFFDPQAFATLEAACARLLPQPEHAPPIPLASGIDARLAEGDGDGWRYAAMPPDGEAYRRGLSGLDETARAHYSADFTSLSDDAQDQVLRAVQSGEAEGKIWETLPAARFFEEFLAEVTECYYSHPLAQEEIGYVGMADARGWQKIGLDQREPREREEARG